MVVADIFDSFGLRVDGIFNDFYVEIASFGTLKIDLLEKLGIEDLERSAVLIKPSLELEPSTFGMSRLRVSHIVPLLGCDMGRHPRDGKSTQSSFEEP
ncbi:hypothetical protein AVEN_14969-1 [Araneus ventricosus]|uniref:Uncharacterized protein n=1 Tax=Araneus ventricosus TaxID=182803 RepID=A0A4Y2FA18_ARAVE|nr:hypothetical protein AVEN_14969-1 [Araneus ventricosus]